MRISDWSSDVCSSDLIGAIEVPAGAYWGAQTQRSIENFPFGPDERMPIGIVHALAIVKQAAARVNRGHGLDSGLADSIEAAAAQVIAGRHDAQFPLVIWQTRSEAHTSVLQSLKRNSYAVSCLQNKILMN